MGACEALSRDGAAAFTRAIPLVRQVLHGCGFKLGSVAVDPALQGEYLAKDFSLPIRNNARGFVPDSAFQTPRAKSFRRPHIPSNYMNIMIKQFLPWGADGV